MLNQVIQMLMYAYEQQQNKLKLHILKTYLYLLME